VNIAITGIITSMSKQTEWVTFEPLGRRVEVEAGTNLLDAARAGGIQLASLCGGIGICESCIIRLRKGDLSDLTLEEQSAREDGWLGQDERLACQAVPLSKVIIEIPRRSLSTDQRLQLEARTTDVVLEPVTRTIDLHIDPPDLSSPEADAQRVIDAIGEQGVSVTELAFPLLGHLSTRLREQDWRARLVLRNSELLAILPEKAAPLGLAVDLGTTKLALYLLDLTTGETLAQTGAMNPQISLGEDVVSRISYANQGPDEQRSLKEVVIDQLNQSISDLCELGDCERESIVDAVVVGNTAMHHAFLGLPLRQLGVSPYVPAVGGSVLVRAKEIGLKLAPGAYVYLPPNIAGYVGADHSAMLLATGFTGARGPTLAVDIGTNTEISLQIGDRILSCSCASGPAFEGAHIRDGMRASPGAIERIQATQSGLRYQTIGDQAPIGICGSGILDALAAFRTLGWLEPSGRISFESIKEERYRHEQGICLVQAEESGHGSDLVIRREDVHEIQLAQAAIRVGIEVLLSEADLEASELETLVLAGAFGTYLHVPSAVQLGMLPEIPFSRIEQVGNAAGEGARQLLLSGETRDQILDLLERVHYVELTTHPSFTELYMQYLFLR
jgi:uncharacterized 2Fe-2S/4Fe-4S cluster protein (DUF4445 family)